MDFRPKHTLRRVWRELLIIALISVCVLGAIIGLSKLLPSGDPVAAEVVMQSIPSQMPMTDVVPIWVLMMNCMQTNYTITATPRTP